MEDSHKEAQGPCSLLQGQGLYFNKIVSRDMSVGHSSSSHIYYRSMNQGVPFKWEKQPGTPKHPRLKDKDKDIIPPPSPPPAHAHAHATTNISIGAPHKGGSPRWLSRLLWFLKLMKLKHNKRSEVEVEVEVEVEEDDFNGYNTYSSSSSSSNSMYSFSTTSITPPNFHTQLQSL